MRVTNKMMIDRVSYNTQAALKRFLDMQTQMSSGRRINKPSDDPLGIQRDLDYRHELAKNSQFLSNVARAQDWEHTYDSLLAEANTLLSSTRELAIAMSSEVADDDGTSRGAAAVEIQEMFDQILQMANTKIEGKFIFSGYRTDQRAIIASSNGVRYNGDTGEIKFQIDNSTDMMVNLIGSDVFLEQLCILGESADLNVGLVGSTLLADLHNGDGVSLVPGTIEITDQNLGIAITVDLSTATTIDQVLLFINGALTASGMTNITATIGAENNNIMFDTTENGLISDVTSLSVINSGNGVELFGGNIRVTDYAAIDFQVDFSSCETVGDIITEFNSQVAGAGISNVTMQINAAGTGFEIRDTNGVPLGLFITETHANSTVAADLGIDGAINPILVGDDLNPTVSFLIEDIGGTTAEELGIAGEFFGDFPGSDLDPLLLPTSNVADLNNGLGYDLDEIILWQGEFSQILDLGDPGIVTVQDMLDAFNNCGLDITASINPDGRGIQIVNNDVARSLTIEDINGGTTARQMGIYGSSDMLGSYIVLINALQADDQDAVGLLLGNFEEAIERLLDHRSGVGAKSIRLGATSSRLLDRELAFTRRLSEVEDADITELITQLSTFENNYQAALLASARIIQPTLLDFMK
ncbi:MAG: flagellar hook-associated protein FlgL [Candidatus Zixiibacteriota bacterium]|nr:MAG: flagellar hook-associated protein FlgL [candidate division Zixibacteria bacterium]